MSFNNINDLIYRLKTLEDNYDYKYLYQKITTPSGTITTYEETEIYLDDWAEEFDEEVNCIIREEIGGRPTTQELYDSSGEIITATLDSLGNYVLSGVPLVSDYCILYFVYGKSKDIALIPLANIIAGFSSKDLDIWEDTGSDLKMTIPRNLDLQNKNIKNVSNVQYNTSYVETETEPVGSTFYDTVNQCYTTVLANGVRYQHGQEMIPLFKNQTGDTIPDGTPVGFAGGVGVSGRIKITPMIADGSIPAKYYIGVTTQEILDGVDGKVATFGAVRGIKTNYTSTGIWGTTWVAGQEIFVSPTVAGQLTNVQPQAPDCAISVGAVQIIHANLGQIASRPQFFPKLTDLCDVNGTPLNVSGLIPVWDNARKVFDFTYNVLVSKSSTGFTNKKDVIITGNSTNRTVALSGTTWKAFYLGLENADLINGYVSPAHLDNTNPYYLVFDGTDIKWVAVGLQKFTDILIAYTWYAVGSNKRVYQRECHGLIMDSDTHKENHEVIGTHKESGGTIGDYVLDSTIVSERRPSVSTTVLDDEDLPTTNPALASEGVYTQFNLTSTGLANFVDDALDICKLNGNQPYYNLFTDPNWTQALMTNNYYSSTWLVGVPMASDTDSQKYRYFWVQGQSQHATYSGEKALTPNDVNFGDFKTIAPEFVILGRGIKKYLGGNWEIIEVESIDGTKFSQSSSPQGNQIVETDNTLEGDGTVSNPLGISGVENSINKTASFTLTDADKGKLIVVNSASDIDLTVPQTTTEIIEAGAYWKIQNIGDGDVNIVKEGFDVLEGNVLIRTDGYAKIYKRIEGSPNTYEVLFGNGSYIFTLDEYYRGAIVAQTEMFKFPEYDGRIINMSAIIRSGTSVDVAILINSVAVTSITLTATTSRVKVPATALNEFVAGDKLEVQFSNPNTSPVDAFVEIECIGED